MYIYLLYIVYVCRSIRDSWHSFRLELHRRSELHHTYSSHLQNIHEQLNAIRIRLSTTQKEINKNIDNAAKNHKQASDILNKTKTKHDKLKYIILSIYNATAVTIDIFFVCV